MYSLYWMEHWYQLSIPTSLSLFFGAALISVVSPVRSVAPGLPPEWLVVEPGFESHTRNHAWLVALLKHTALL